MKININFSQTNSQIIDFSAKELARYLGEMMADSLISINNQSNFPNPDLTICLKTADLCCEYGMDPVDNPEFDDQYVISVTDNQGVIAGSNPRSVLLGVYHYLRSLGCRFLAPGSSFESIPPLYKKEELFCSCKRTASLRHRGVCLEGSSSLENILDFVDWLPKLGYNCFFLQFQIPYTFMARWYHHEMNPLLAPEEFSKETALSYTEQVTKAMDLRGVILHQVGHGWTGGAIGQNSCDWKPLKKPLDPAEINKLALLNGKRQLFHGIPMNTNLCYSNPDAIDSFTRQVTDYILAHPSVDYLHVWLADEPNNICECPDCQKTTPSDQYVELLNHIDEALTRLHSPVKIVFLLYQELLWAPKHARFRNPDRFLLMFAPISRTFDASYQTKDSSLDSDHLPALPLYERNRISLPTSLEENLAHLKAWQNIFSGDSFIYDYPLGRAHYGDFGYIHISRIISEDIKKIRSMGLNGYISCQELRCGFPNFLPNYVMGYTLFDETASFQELVQEYFSAAYGHGWEEVLSYLTDLSNLCSCDYFNGKGERISPSTAEHMELLLKRAASFGQDLPSRTHTDKPENLFWKHLDYHREYSLQLGKALLLLSKGETDAAQQVWHDFQNWICQNESSFQSCLDVYRVSEVSTKYTGFLLEEPLKNTL
ncbi:MAG: DUF4838 domain-containing protein [Lachnospiraceae bacterium]